MLVSKVAVVMSDGTSQEFAAVKLYSSPVVVKNDLYFPAPIILGAQISHKKFYPKGPFVSVTLAQWALESDFGKDVSGTNNYLGIKATQAQMAAGRARYVFTREETADGRSYTIRAAFANYDNVSDCFDAHATLLISSHYQKCMDAKTPEEYCVALQEDGYATAHNYAQSLIELINSHNLKQYDEVL